MTNLLTYSEYQSTRSARMLDVTARAEAEVDIWPYVEALIDEDEMIPAEILESRKVKTVYRNAAETFDHVLLPTIDPAIFVIIIVDLEEGEITGHYLINVNESRPPA